MLRIKSKKHFLSVTWLLHLIDNCTIYFFQLNRVINSNHTSFISSRKENQYISFHKVERRITEGFIIIIVKWKWIRNVTMWVSYLLSCATNFLCHILSIYLIHMLDLNHLTNVKLKRAQILECYSVKSLIHN